MNYCASTDAVRGNPEVYLSVLYNAGANNVGSSVCINFNIHGLETTIGSMFWRVYFTLLMQRLDNFPDVDQGTQ
jgi:hypothetical protein